MITALIILAYIVCFIACYLLCKIVRNQSDSNTWGDVITTLIMSALGPIGLIVIGCVYLSETEPPKWL